MNAAATAAPALSVKGITVGYQGVPAVRDLSFEVHPGEILALLGPNGAGKTTTLLASVGALPVMSGQISALGAPIDRRIERTSRRGLALVPDSRGVFRQLRVQENLALSKRRGGPPVESVFDHFPKLKTLLRQTCGNLSGGEQQMLALGKVMLQEPKVLLIDELSMGLSPIAVQDILPRLRAIATEQAIAVVLVEQHIDLALAIADTSLVLHHGRVALAGPAERLRRDRQLVEAAYFGTTESNHQPQMERR
ncbi:ATP-binding cassette domain-containing protein [Nocardioides marmoriginsengisoli]|uniref:ATP-binding cassette domain-containing protein n=1 Tax=Nocardioides marmoriginsengisoli TaxID=661483 RepID=A0A3N0CH14_9ACTN|nr:ATP-binding cassette domain-containing protein [Nocardioides marmoriginsengisoli]RNL62734.1 ATP-binding cassette domain-containing protein [Nocardioides marmoriginsengisoli]